MSPFIVLPVAIIALIVTMYYLGIWCNIWPPLALFKREYELDYVESQKAVEINPNPRERFLATVPGTLVTFHSDGTVEFTEPKEAVEVIDYIDRREWMRAEFRARNPHLFDDDWFETSYREYSIHAVRHVEERNAFRREMGLAA